MLELGTLPANISGKVRKHSSKEGVFVYSVDADRENERKAGSSAALLKDESGANQAGERKVIPFRVNNIVSAGDIKIYSQVENVVFNEKIFRVQNKSISGRLKYNKDGKVYDVPYEAFVVLERIKTYNRIGTVTIGNLIDGHNMNIRLRSEYTYNWYNDPVKIQYADVVRVASLIYEKEFPSLDALYTAAATGDIILE